MLDVATLGIKVDASGAISDLRKLDTALDRTGTAGSTMAGKVKTEIARLGAQVRSLGPLLAVGLATAAFKKMVDETIEAQNAQAQLRAAIQSTGGAAGVTERQLNDMAAAMQRTSTYSEEAIKGAQAVLLTFTQIKGAEFSNATQAVLDLSARMGTDLKGAALQVGKALQDPIRGITALGRAGVSFSNEQRAVIEKLVETGRAAEAQRIILKELGFEFANSASQARNTLGGALGGLKEAFGNLFELTEANGQSTIRYANALETALIAWNKFANRNVADFGDVTSGGGIRQLATVTINAAAITDADREAGAAKRLAEIRRTAADRQHAAEVLAAADILLRGEEEERYLGFVQKIADALSRQAEAAKQIRGSLTVESQLSGVREETAALAAGAAKQITDAADASKKMANAMSAASAIISQAAADFLVKKLGGGTFGGALGGGVGRAAAGSLGGFGGTATGQALFGPIFAGFGAAIGKSIDSLFDFSGSIKAAREAMAKLRESLARSLELERAKATGGNVAQIEAENSVREYYERLREETDKAFKIRSVAKGATRVDREINRLRDKEIADKKARMEELAMLEKVAIDRVRQSIAEAKKAAREDLEVRALTAAGKDKEAEALRRELADRREEQEAKNAGLDEAYIARLKEVQALERSKKAIDDLTASVRNAPAGFKVQPYSFDHGASSPNPANRPPAAWPPTGGLPNTPLPWGRPASGGTGTPAPVTIQFFDTDFKIEGNTTEELFKSFIQTLRKKKDATLGVAGTLSEALDRQ